MFPKKNSTRVINLLDEIENWNRSSHFHPLILDIISILVDWTTGAARLNLAEWSRDCTPAYKSTISCWRRKCVHDTLRSPRTLNPYNTLYFPRLGSSSTRSTDSHIEGKSLLPFEIPFRPMRLFEGRRLKSFEAKSLIDISMILPAIEIPFSLSLFSSISPFLLPVPGEIDSSLFLFSSSIVISRNDMYI